MTANRLDRLSERDVEIVRECLTAAVRGPFFPDWEFGTLMGLTRDEVQRVLLDWPASGDEERRDVAINNVLNNLLGYPHGEESSWFKFISVDPAEVANVLARWRGDHEPETGAYFDRLA